MFLIESFIWWKTVECILEDGPAELYQIHKGYRAMALTMTGPPASPPRFEKLNYCSHTTVVFDSHPLL